MNPTQCFNYPCDKSILVDDNYRSVPANGEIKKELK